MINPDNFLSDEEVKSFFESLTKELTQNRRLPEKPEIYGDIAACTAFCNNANGELNQIPQLTASQTHLHPSCFWNENEFQAAAQSQAPVQQIVPEMTLADILLSQNTELCHSTIANMDPSLMQFCPLTPISMERSSPLEGEPPQEANTAMAQLPYQPYEQFNSGLVQDFRNRVQTDMNPIAQILPQRERRHRTKYTNYQMAILEREFLESGYSCPKPRQLILAELLNLSELQVRNWFRNRKQKLKKKSQTGQSDVMVQHATSELPNNTSC